MLKQINDTIAYLESNITNTPEIGIILGTGLGELVNEIQVVHSIDYSNIPNFPVSTVEGHEGRLIFGTLNGKNIVAMQGRFHYYEGYSMKEVTFPVRIMKSLGVTHLFLSNASGGLNPDFEIGDIMCITDHINLFPENPLRGENYAELGPRFLDMSQPYDNSLIEHAITLAASNAIKVHRGIYAGVSGPTFETPAEYRYIRSLGADAVGMSTVPEVIVARHMGVKTFGVSVITDSGVPGEIVEISHEDVQNAAAQVAPRLRILMKQLVKQTS